MKVSLLIKRVVGIAAVGLILYAVAWHRGWGSTAAAPSQDARPAASSPAPSGAQRGKGAGGPPVAVTTSLVKQQDVPNYRAGIGTATALQSVTVKTRVDGQLDKVGFTEGQDVKAGQMIAQLDPRTLRAQLAQVQATRAKDAAQLANARVDLRRYTQLQAEEASTQQQVDTQKALVSQLEAAVQNDEAAIAYAQVQLGFTTITAPISGRVGARLVDPGNIVHASDAGGIVVINQIDPIAVIFTLPEEAFRDVNHAVNAGRERQQSLVVQAYPRNGKDLLGTGKLILVNNQIDTASATFTLKASFPNPTHELWPGQYVNVRLMLGDHASALTLPAQAVQRGQSGTYVYAVNDDATVRLQDIEVAQIQDGIAVVTKGLQAGERIVVDGQYKLKPGARISEASVRRGSDASSPASASAASDAQDMVASARENRDAATAKPAGATR